MLSTSVPHPPSSTTCQEVRAEELIKKIQTDNKRLQKEIAVQEEDLKYLDKGDWNSPGGCYRLDGQSRARQRGDRRPLQVHHGDSNTKTKAEIAPQQQLEANKDTAEFTQLQLTELSAGTTRVERDAVIVVQQKLRAQAGTVRLGYFREPRPTGGRSTGGKRRRWPRAARIPRCRGTAYRRKLVGSALRFRRARPSLDAAPPDLISAQDGRAGRAIHRAGRRG